MLRKTKFFLQLFIVIIFLILNAAPSLSQAGAFDLFAVSDMAAVFEDGYDCPPPERAIDVFGIRGEYISAQCVIKATGELQNVTVSVSFIKNEDTGISLPDDAVSWNFVGGIFIEKNTPNLKQTDLLRPAPAWFPDYLSEERELSIKKGNYKAVWLTIKIPRNAQAGKYSGTVSVNTGQGNASIPLHLTIYPLTMPYERNLYVTMWYTTGKFDKYHDVKEPYSYG
ncbi:unnamed protein product, partial [marine sediment metagenome]